MYVLQGGISFCRQTDAWGKRIDEIVTCEAWKEQKRIAAREGLISIPYQNEQVTIFVSQ